MDITPVDTARTVRRADLYQCRCMLLVFETIGMSFLFAEFMWLNNLAEILYRCVTIALLLPHSRRRFFEAEGIALVLF